ncbi:MAG: CHASE domain-containing protein [Verrucomicrobiota bacterium]
MPAPLDKSVKTDAGALLSAPARVIDVLHGAILRNRWGGLGLLAAGLICTAIASLYMKANVTASAQHEFDFACAEIRLNIDARLAACAQVLYGGAAFFDAAESVERTEWRAFTQSLYLDHRLPGIQGIGFAQLIPADQLTRHVQEIRGQGFPDYQVRPAGERTVYSSIIYIEPFSGRNVRAFGYDMLSEPVRRAAMEWARDENAASLSGKVVLVQETQQDVQAGTLMYVPVYQRGVPIETIDQRRVALQGWVYSPYRMTDLMRGTLRGWDVRHPDMAISVQVYDGGKDTADALMYDSQSAEAKAVAATPIFTRLATVDFGGHRWTLRFIQSGGLAFSHYASVWLVLAGGTSITLLLSALFFNLLNTRLNARRMAWQLTTELRESETRFRLVTDTAPVLLWQSGKDALCDYFNQPWLKFTGRTLEQELGNGWAEGVHPDDYQRCLDIYLGAFKARATFSMEYRLRRADGEYRWVLGNGAPRFTATGIFIGFIGSCIDITDHKRMEEKEKLQAQKQHLLKTESLSRMAGAVAHHFNNKLQAVMGYLELAQDTQLKDAELAECLSGAMHSVRKAAEVSSLMLTYLGQVPGERELLNLADICRKNLSALQADMPNGVILKSDLSSPGPVISANANQIQQILTNLITNAWEACNAKQGVVLLSVKKALASDNPAEHRFPVGAQTPHPAYACIEVTDTGCGIAEQNIEKLFDPFFSTKFIGRGMGLASVLGIVGAHKGIITVANKPGGGSIFRVYLPMTADEILVAPKKMDQAPAIQRGGTVLLVEDEVAIRKLTTIFLTRLGFTVLAAKDGVEALEVFQQHQNEIRFVLSDLRMPRMDGWETLTALRRIAPGIPVILASGYDKEQAMEGDHPEQPQAFLQKPYQREQLSAAIRQALPEEPSRADAAPTA